MKMKQTNDATNGFHDAALVVVLCYPDSDIRLKNTPRFMSDYQYIQYYTVLVFRKIRNQGADQR